MITAVTLALALAFERTEDDVMDRPPRDPHAPLLTGFLVWGGLLGNGYALEAVGLLLAFQMLFTYLPAMTASLGLSAWVRIEVIGSWQ